MKITITNINHLYYLLALAIFTILGLLWYSNSLVQRLAEKEERLVSFWADVYEYVANNSNAETAFLVNNIILKKPPIITVPAIAIDQDGNFTADNITLEGNADPASREKILRQEFKKMEANQFQPLNIELGAGKFLKVYYRETDELIQLRYYPYLNLAIMILFMSILFANFYTAQKNQQNAVWVGLAKETAHQLGTPIMGLIAWVELLRDKINDAEDEMIVTELEKDIRHLDIIANRFSKIGSTPELKPTDLSEILTNSINYLRSRLARSGAITMELNNELPPRFEIPVSAQLLEWVIENLLKNAMDAMAERRGKIELHVFRKNEFVIIDVSDMGKGIHPQNVKNIFKPGFTTKKRGWGLGLSLSKRIISEFHKGKIFVKKTELGVGATFRIILPIAPDKMNRFQRFWKMLKLEKLDP
jgi:two-component sensor histidine kinase